MSRTRKRKPGDGAGAPNGGGEPEASPAYLFDLSEEVCRTNRPFPIAHVDGEDVRIKLLAASLSEDWLASKALIADEVEVQQQTAFKRLQAAQTTARDATGLEAQTEADADVERLSARVRELKVRRLALVRAAVAGYAPELAAVAEKMTVVQLYEAFIRLVKYSDPGLVGGSLQLQHMLGTSSGPRAFQQLIGQIPNSSHSGRKSLNTTT